MKKFKLIVLLMILSNLIVTGCKKNLQVTSEKMQKSLSDIIEDDLDWSDYFTTEELLYVANHPLYSTFFSDVNDLFISFENIDSNLYQSYNNYFSSFFGELILTYPQFIGKEDYMYLLLDQIIDEFEEGGLCYGFQPLSGLYKGVNALNRRFARADRQFKSGAITQYEHCCKINSAITKFNNKNGREIYHTTPCDDYFNN